ncbi:MAG: hypothetical protein QM605_15465, partial [Sphingobium sp.]
TNDLTLTDPLRLEAAETGAVAHMSLHLSHYVKELPTLRRDSDPSSNLHPREVLPVYVGDRSERCL